MYYNPGKATFRTHWERLLSGVQRIVLGDVRVTDQQGRGWMKPWVAGVAVVVMTGWIGVLPGEAATDNVLEGMKDKAVSGAVDLVTGIVELPMQIYKGYKNGFEPVKNDAGSKVVGTVLGIFKGLGHAAGRTSWGAMELFGFWTANPKDNAGVGIPLDAQYAWEEGEPYNLFKPSLAEGIKPIGRKLVHGFANSFGGIAELPGQTLQGKRDGNLLKGVGRGVWFWLSREVYGFSSLYTCLVPNPKDNPGYAFDGDWPWSSLATEPK